MGNLLDELAEGQKGKKLGLPMGLSLKEIDKAIFGVRRKAMYGIAGASKSGKSTFTDYAFIIQPYLAYLQDPENINIEWIYFSFEIDRVSKEFDFLTFFLYNDYNITHMPLSIGSFYKGESRVPLSSNLLQGFLRDDEDKVILLDEEIKKIINKVYHNRIIPLFGEYNSNGIQIKKGKIIFEETRDNPTGLYYYLRNYAEEHGKFVKSESEFNKRTSHYVPKDPNKYTIIITDHLRKLLGEKNYSKKETLDKYIEYSVDLRNLCSFTFVHILHLNRSMNSVERAKLAGDMLYPTSEDVKGTGNLGEETNYLITIFNPNDTRYNLTSHFGKEIRDTRGNLVHPNLRTLHIVENRHGLSPLHFRILMLGALKAFERVPKI